MVELTFTKAIRKYADSGYSITIPREIIEYLGLKKGDLLECKVKLIPRSENTISHQKEER